MPFDGQTYDHRLDRSRLSGQLLGVFMMMQDGKWRTLEDLATIVKGSEAGVSARLRDLRKPRFGGYTVERRRKGKGGLHEYRLLIEWASQR